MTCDRIRGARAIGVSRGPPQRTGAADVATEPARTLVLVVHGPLRRSQLPGLFARVCGLLGEHEPHLVVCKVAGVGADAVAVDALARLGLAARRYGAAVRLQGAAPALHEIVAFAGLSEALPGEAS